MTRCQVVRHGRHGRSSPEHDCPTGKTTEPFRRAALGALGPLLGARKRAPYAAARLAQVWGTCPARTWTPGALQYVVAIGHASAVRETLSRALRLSTVRRLDGAMPQPQLRGTFLRLRSVSRLVAGRGLLRSPARAQ